MSQLIKKEIVIDIERIKNPNNGLHNFLTNLILQFENSKSEFSFTYYLPRSVKLPFKLKRKNQYFWHKINFFNSFKYDLWHVTNQGIKYLPWSNIPIVLTIHDLNYLYTDKSEFKKQKYLVELQKKIDRATMVTVISKYVYEDVLKHFKVDIKKLKIIYNGVNLIHFTDDQLKKVNPKSTNFLLSIGTVLYKKHFHVLPKLLVNNNCDLIIAGVLNNKGYQNRIINEAKKYGVESRVKLIGTISEIEKYWYIKNCKAFLFPSIMEGFGLPPIEAMLLGKPVFLSNKTSLPEVGGDVAYYFNNFDDNHMIEVFEKGMKDYKENDRKEKIILWGKKYDWKKTSEEYLNIYKQILQNSK